MAVETKMYVAVDANAEFVAACSVIGGWQPVGGTAGLLYLSTSDVTPPSPLVDPSGMTETGGRRLLTRDNRMGTLLGLRMVYNTGLSNITSPVVKVFGRTRTLTPESESPGSWQILKNRLGDLSVPLTVASTDVIVTLSGPKATTPDPFGHYWDCQGCNEFLVGVEIPMSATGTVSAAVLEAKII